MKSIYEEYVDFDYSLRHNALHFSILDFTKHLCMKIDDDFAEFCRQYDKCIVSHGDRATEDGCLFKFELLEGYTIYICTEVSRVKSFHIENKHINERLCLISG